MSRPTFSFLTALMVKNPKHRWCKVLWTLGMKDNKRLRLLAYVDPLGQSGITPPERVPGGGKPDPAGTPAGATPVCPMRRGPLWPRSVSDSDARRWHR